MSENSQERQGGNNNFVPKQNDKNKNGNFDQRRDSNRNKNGNHRFFNGNREKRNQNFNYSNANRENGENRRAKFEKTFESATDIANDTARIEKEILLEINEIKSIDVTM